MTRSAPWAVAALALALLASAGCGTESAGGSVRANGVYLSLGDSYAAGYQPLPRRAPEVYRHGYAYLLASRARRKGYRLSLVNLGCGGATVETMTSGKGCPVRARSPGGPSYAGSQLDYAVGYLHRHPGAVSLVTVAIGLNDAARCLTAPDIEPCLSRTMDRSGRELERGLSRLRDAAGPDTVIVGLTYPDVALGSWVRGGAPGRALARRSVDGFHDVVDPALERGYESVDGLFVDVTRATGAYTPLDRTTTLAPYGRLPVAVADVCRLTWSCAEVDVHPRDPGYERIAELIVDALPQA